MGNMMKKTIALLLAVCLACSLAPGAAAAAEEADLTQEQEEMFENIIGLLWWDAGFPVGQLPLTDELQLMLIRSMTNEGRIPQVKDMVWPSVMGRYAVTEGDMEKLFDSLTASRAPDAEFIEQYSDFDYANGLYSAPYATGDMAVYYPQAVVGEAVLSGETLTLRGMLYVAVDMSYTGQFYRFEAVLQKNGESIFGGWSLVSVYTEDLNRAVQSVSADSVLAPQVGNTYDGANAYDQNYATAWVEGASGTGVGCSVTFTLNGPEMVYGISVLPGYWKSPELYERNGRPTELVVSFSDGTSRTMALQGADAGSAAAEESYEHLLLDTPVMTSSVTVTISAAVAGTRFDDTCITEIELLK